MPLYTYVNTATGDLWNYKAGWRNPKGSYPPSTYSHIKSTKEKFGPYSWGTTPALSAGADYLRANGDSAKFGELRNLVAANLMDQVRSANLGNALATIDDTFGMISSRVVQAYYAARALKRGQLKTAASLLKASPSQIKPRKSRPRGASAPQGAANYTGSAWLEVQYGWAPLISDITSLANEFDDAVREVRRELRLTAKSSSTVKVAKYVTANHTYDPYKIEMSACGTVFITSAPPASMVLGLSNPLEALWEWVPFSFVADWFGPIGTKISAMDPYLSSMLTRGTLAVKAKYSNAKVTSKHYSGKTYGAIYQGSSFHRTLGITPVWAWHTKLIKGEAPFRALNAAALMAALKL